MRNLHFTILVTIFVFISSCSPKSEIDYLKSLHPENEVKRLIQLSYSNDLINPVSEEVFDSLRSKIEGESFIDPNFGREWTFVYNGGHSIMNSERNNWNADTSIFFLEESTTTTSRTLVLFDGHSMEILRRIVVDGLTQFNDTTTRTALRWMPEDPELLFYLKDNKIFTVNINTGEQEVFEEFSSFNLINYDFAGGDGNDVAPNGDLLIGNREKSCFVYNMLNKKVVRVKDGERVYLDPRKEFPTFDLDSIDYAVAFAGHIIEVNRDSTKIMLKDINGNLIQTLFNGTPHMDPTYYFAEGKLYPGVSVRYKEKNVDYYEAQGFPSEAGKAYFHGFDPDDPLKFVRFPLDSWPSDPRGSGAMHSCNRYTGTSGLMNTHGPIQNNLEWQARYGECYEQSFREGESEIPRRFANHYLGYTERYRPNRQPEGWLSPDGTFAVIKTKWGWYKVQLYEKLSKEALEKYLNKP